jgi:hypothetical protein
MESQASALPVIVTDQGGPQEVVDDGVTGFVIPASDEAGWIDRIVDLASNREKCRRMGNAAHQAMQPFSMARSFEHYWQVHERVWVQHLAQHAIKSRGPAQDARGIVETLPLPGASRIQNRVPGYEHAAD